MEVVEILDRIKSGKDDQTQFKEKLTNANSLAQEFVAFSNASGGVLIVGVSDNGEILGLDESQIRKYNQLISNASNENVRPPIYPLTEIITINDKKLIIISVKNGDSKPYQISDGLYLTKSGSDKRKISTEELRRLFSISGRIFADEEILLGSSMNDLNSELFYDFLRKDSEIVYNELNIGKLNLKNILENLQIFKKGNLTLAGNLFFGKNVKKFSPSFYVDAVNFDGYEISTSNFISKAEFSGTLSQNFSDSMNFLKSNLKQIQTSPEFNSIPKLEIDEVILTELIINAFIHRDYYIQSSIKIFIFYNRVEIISPGKLTNSLTIENIKSGISIHRNPILNSLGKRILPYSGYGSGIRRALSIDPTIEFVNDTNKEEFKCIINRL